MDFFSPEYLRTGNAAQRISWSTLSGLDLFSFIRPWNGVLAGTIPLDIHTENSDLDLLCQCADLEDLKQKITAQYHSVSGFEVQIKSIRNRQTLLARLGTRPFPVEIFAQNRPVTEQEGYQHLVVEYALLEENPALRDEVRQLKREGMKTEPAFALALGLPGDPWQALLDLGVERGWLSGS